ncbi:MAG TPA: hypothetical protein EYG28_03430 [Nitrospiria bacterium]|nr:hypothetical protein [Candidatus Manganitrophaceae bacterium]
MVIAFLDRYNCFFSRIHPKKGFQLTGFYYGGEMKVLGKSKLKQKIPIGVLILILIGVIAGCREGGSSAPGIEDFQDKGARQDDLLPASALRATVLPAQSPNSDLAFDTEDLDFILKQIEYAERHAAGEDLIDILPNASVPWGLRTVDGTFNSLIPGQENFGAADQEFPFAVPGRNFPAAQNGTTYDSAATVQDSTPRLTSHLIVNQSTENPAAIAAAAAEGGVNIGPDIAGTDQFFIPNTAPDEGLSAPTNAFMTFFGQFFDHGLDLVNKGGNGVVIMPLQPDDPLFDAGVDGDPLTLGDNGPNMMIMPRASRNPGPDGIPGNADDTFINATTPHVDQQQTYGSHASAQILLRHYEVRGGVLQNSGHLIDGFGNDRILDTADDGGMATWDAAQLQALQKFGIILDDQDGNNIPMFLSDPYGNFIPGPASGLPQLVTSINAETGIPTLLEGNLTTPVDASLALRVNHSFFLDVAHTAAPNGTPDVDLVINARTDDLSGQVTRGIRASAPAGQYDDELLGAHFVCGDGRCNENIALTTIHTIFHHEHNRLADVAKRVVLDAGDLTRLNEWLNTPVTVFPPALGLTFLVSDASLANQAATRAAIDVLSLDWNGERIFQAARFGTEMQYNRIVFDEFGPTLAGLKDAFAGFHTNVDPTITTEFSQSVYRFGHSMLTTTVDRYDANFKTILDDFSGDASQLGLFEAFLNPLALYNSDASGVAQLTPEVATGTVIRGLTRTVANEIDEFITGALQNNLVGLPLDLGAINIARGRDVGNPTLNAARRSFYAATQDTRLTPYAHWADYADNLRHEASLVNFIAAYGTHESLAGIDGIVGNGDDPVTTFADRRAAACAIVGELTTIGDLTPNPAEYCVASGFINTLADAVPTPTDAMDFLFSMNTWASDADGRTITGMDDVDFWNGGLAEERMPFGGYLGSTHNYVFETQLEHLQNGDRFYYVGRTANIHFLGELESNSFTALAMRTTDLGEQGAGALSLNIFSVPNHILEVDQSQQFDAAGNGTTADPEGDAALTPLVIRDSDQLTTNIDVFDTTNVIQYTGGDHVTIGGTDSHDTIIGGIGDDAISGGVGNDRIEGGDGADLIEGGSGDDIITDLSGPDVIEGGAGNDAINSGNEEDVIFGDDGNDFIVNPSELGEIFGGLGDDYIFDGEHNSHIRGGAGDDWMENVGGGEDLFQGDNGAAAELGEPLVKGHDVFIAHGGNNDADMENGDDIVVDGPGIDRVEGQLGFDWISFQNDRFGVDVDLDLSIFLPPQLPPSNATVLNRYDRVEGMSGSPFGDFLKGTANEAGEEDGNQLVNFGLIDGIEDLVPLSERRALAPDLVTGEAQFGWTGGEIILGGGGSDVITGEGGDDIIDGDASLTVMIRTPDPAIRTGVEWVAYRAALSAATSTESQSIKNAAAAAAFVQAKVDADAAVEAATIAALSAVAAADSVAATLTNDITITGELGDLISGGSTGPTVEAAALQEAAWQDFLNRCSTIMLDLDLQLQLTTADTAAEAIAAQASALVAQLAAEQVNLDSTALASAASAAAAQLELDAARTLLPADTFVLVPGMQDVMDAVFGGFINPGELSISRVISSDPASLSDTDTAVYTGNQLDYSVDLLAVPGWVQVTDNRVPPLNVDGRDLVRNVERLRFADGLLVNPEQRDGGDANTPAEGQPTITGILIVGSTLTASIDGVTDADNLNGQVTSAVAWTWELEYSGHGVFTPIIRNGVLGNGPEIGETSQTLLLTVAENGLRVRVKAVFQDDDGVFEIIVSGPALIDDGLVIGNVELSGVNGEVIGSTTATSNVSQ